MSDTPRGYDPVSDTYEPEEPPGQAFAEALSALGELEVSAGAEDDVFTITFAGTGVKLVTEIDRQAGGFDNVDLMLELLPGVVYQALEQVVERIEAQGLGEESTNE